ncbi:MAG: hypothetical protein V2A34_04455 [Lentisphaerota bacterium]
MKKFGRLLLASVLFVAWTAPVVLAAEKKETSGKTTKSSSQPKAEKKIEPKVEKKVEKAEPVAKKEMAAKPVGKTVTQAELGQLLVRVLGIARFLPANPTDQQCFALLMANGIQPVTGWNSTAEVKKADLARVIVQAMKKQGEVKNPDDPASWVDYLKSIGIPIDTVGEAVDYVDPLGEPVARNVVAGTSDPLVKRQQYNPIDETQYGTDMVALNRIFSQLEFDSGEFRPVPITQD